jgi:hypothetical protein
VNGAGLDAAVGEAVFWIALLSCVAAEIAILRAVFRVRANADAPPRPGRAPLPRLRRGVEILWALLPAIALALVLLMTWRAMRAGHASPSPSPRASSRAAWTGDFG